MRFARLLLLTLTPFATLSTSAAAAPINVSGSMEYGPLPFGAPGPFGLLPGATVSLTGDRGFTFNGFVLGSLGFTNAIAPAAQCGVGCSPGSTISLNALAINTDIVGQATLDGVSYPVPGSPTAPNLQLFFSGQVVAPSFGSSPTADLTVPVDFAGQFNVGLLETNQLVAAALATLQLQQITCPSGSPFCSGQAWQYEGIRYDLEPTQSPPHSSSSASRWQD